MRILNHKGNELLIALENRDNKTKTSERVFVASTNIIDWLPLDYSRDVNYAITDYDTSDLICITYPGNEVLIKVVSFEDEPVIPSIRKHNLELLSEIERVTSYGNLVEVSTKQEAMDMLLDVLDSETIIRKKYAVAVANKAENDIKTHEYALKMYGYAIILLNTLTRTKD